MGYANGRVRRAIALATFTLALPAGAFVACGGDDNAGGGPASDDDVVVDSGKDVTIANDGADNDGGITCSVTPCASALGVGGSHTCALTTDGTLYCWGMNYAGATGVGAVDGSVVDPEVVTAPTKIDAGPVSSLAAGAFNSTPAFDFEYTCGLSATGGVACWGSNYYLALGRGDDGGTPFDPHAAPVAISNATQLSGGAQVVCALTTSGGISCWGSNALKQLVDPIAQSSVPHPLPFPGGTTFTSVSVGLPGVCAVATDGHVWCWGTNLFDVLGRAPTDGGIADTEPAQVAGLTDIAEVAIGEYSACALSHAGVVSCWGGDAALGRGDVDSGTFDPNPAPVVAAGATFTHLVGAAGAFCALDSSGGVWCWGANVLGTTGTGTLVDAGFGAPMLGSPNTVTAPAKVSLSGPVSVLATSSGSGHVCVILQTGAVQCWGANKFDQLGSATTDPVVSITPVDVHLE